MPHQVPNPFLRVKRPSSSWLLDEDALYLEPMAILPPGDEQNGESTREALILRDDLLHPFANGNKLRKLDAYLPKLIARGVTDILTCGGAQSAHCAALACLGAERGVRVHVLLRGEPPGQLAGNLAITILYAHHVTWVDRDTYADRDAMLAHHRSALQDKLDTTHHGHLHVIPEGAADPLALEGSRRLVQRLTHHLPRPDAPWKLLVDSGTGTFAAGLLAGILAEELPWTVMSVMLMPDQREHYTHTICELATRHRDTTGAAIDRLELLDRQPPRRFGKLIATEIRRCHAIARRTGVLFDPIYTLAAYDALCVMPGDQDAHTLLIHTGGALNMAGVMSRKPHLFLG